MFSFFFVLRWKFSRKILKRFKMIFRWKLFLGNFLGEIVIHLLNYDDHHHCQWHHHERFIDISVLIFMYLPLSVCRGIFSNSKIISIFIFSDREKLETFVMKSHLGFIVTWVCSQGHYCTKIWVKIIAWTFDGFESEDLKWYLRRLESDKRAFDECLWSFDEFHAIF